MPSAQPPTAQPAIEGANALAAAATTITLSGPTSGVNRRCIDKLHRDGKRGCFWKRGNHASDYGEQVRSHPSSPTIASGTTSDNLHLYAGVSESASINITNDGGLDVPGSPITYTSSAADTTAPTLSSATGTKTSQTTGTSGVTTNEGKRHARCSLLF